MLYMDEATRRRLRGIQDSWLEKQRPRKRKQQATRKIKKEHRRRLIDGTAAILKAGDPTPFAFEAFCRHDLRSGLCLRGWRWADADAAADDIVQAALRQIGAVRPTYEQGQPEHVQFGVIMFERTRCITCGWKLPEGHRLYCSPTCFEIKRTRHLSRWENEYDKAVRYAEQWRSRETIQP